MIQSITVTNYLGESLTIPLQNSESTGFIIGEVTGLGPPEADVHTSEVATNDGSKFNSARVKERNIVLPLYFTPIPTIEDARQKSYKYFPLKRHVTLRVLTENRECEIDGYVERNDPDIFTDRSGTQISIICPVPYFRAIDETVTTFSNINGCFEFPFSNESLDEKLIEFATITPKAENIVHYDGDAENGIQIRILASATVKNVAIYNVDTRGTMHIYHDKLAALTGSGIVKGDEIIISTVKGTKSVFLLRDGQLTNILNCIGMTDEWFRLAKGDNSFAYTADEGADYLMFIVSHTTLYEGI